MHIREEDDKVKMALTHFGLRVIVSVCFLALLAGFFGDPIIAIVTLAISFLIIYDLIDAWRASKLLELRLKLGSPKVRLRMVVGDVEEQLIELDYTGERSLSVNPPFNWCRVSPLEVGRGRSELLIVFSPNLAGEYRAEGLLFIVKGRLGLNKQYSSAKFQIEVKVYPKVLRAVVEAVSFLMTVEDRWDYGRLVETITHRPGKGLEYAWSRKYQPGDSLRYIDQKATAKRGELIVKEFYADVGLTVHLAYDIRAYGPMSKDELASTFLSSALGLAQVGLPFGLTVHDGNKVHLHLNSIESVAALKVALGFTLKHVEVDPEELFELLDYRSSIQARKLLTKIREESLKSALEAEVEALAGSTEHPYEAITRSIKGPLMIVSVTGLMEDLTSLVELSQLLAQRQGGLTVIQPCKPWLETDNLEKAYKLYQRYRKAEKTLYIIKVSQLRVTASGWRMPLESTV